MKKLETQYNSLQVLSIITKLGTKEVWNYYVMLVKKLVFTLILKFQK